MEKHKAKLEIYLQALNYSYVKAFQQITKECQGNKAYFDGAAWALRRKIDDSIKYAIKIDNFDMHLQLTLDKTVVNLALDELECLLFPTEEPPEGGSNKKGGII